MTNFFSNFWNWLKGLEQDAQKSVLVHSVVGGFLLFAEDCIPLLASVVNSALAKLEEKTSSSTAPVLEAATQTLVQSTATAVDTSLEQLQQVVANNTPASTTDDTSATNVVSDPVTTPAETSAS